MPDSIRALHVIGIIIWMGGLFQLARHLGQHARLESDAAREAFADWEHKAYYFAVLPGMLLAAGTGFYTLFSVGFGTYLDAEGPWGATFHLKLLVVVLLIGADQFVHYRMRALHDGDDASAGPFMAIHGFVALSFIALVFIMEMRLLA